MILMNVTTAQVWWPAKEAIDRFYLAKNCISCSLKGAEMDLVPTWNYFPRLIRKKKTTQERSEMDFLRGFPL